MSEVGSSISGTRRAPGNGRSYPTAADTPSFRVTEAAAPSAAELLLGGAGPSDQHGKASEGHGPGESGKVGNFLPALIRGGQVDTVLVCMCDMQGRLVGKRMTGRHFLGMLGHDMHACDYLLAVDVEMLPIPGLEVSSWEKGFGDFSIRPDLGTARLVPWIPGTAVVLGDTVDAKGTLAPHAPRSILRNQIERLEAVGFSALFASELEFYVFRGDWKAARLGSYRGLEPDGFYSEDYQIFQTSGKERLMRSIRNGMEAAGIAIESSKGEGGPGQAEINLLYAETLEMADRHVIYKNGVKELAQAHDHCVTFMAKWNDRMPGSSCHIHNSLTHLANGQAASADPARPHGFSKVFEHYLAGQVALARDMTLLLAPFVNSYKRFQSGSFAPTKAVWSLDNRTAGFRVLGEGNSLRVECRIPGADVNPYLAYSALIAAGLHGIENELPLGPPSAGNAYTSADTVQIPTTLPEAAQALEQSTILRAALGDAVIEHCVHLARWEQSEADRRVTDWELSRYFERV
jgi:glutamine synthetase